MSMLYVMRGVKKAYDGKVVLDIPDLVIEERRIYAIVGPNGSGKTTLLRLLSFLEPPSEGELLFRGRGVRRSVKELHALRREVTFVMESPYLFHMSVKKNVLYPLRLRSVSHSAAQPLAERFFERLGISDLTGKRGQSLSAGQRQRVALARAFVSGAGTILLDEPTANIDRENVGKVEESLVSLNHERRASVIFSTHDLAQAYRLADEVVMLIDGRLSGTKPENVFSGSIAEVKGTKRMTVAPGVIFDLASERTGRAYISIDPESIILSLREVSSSARNAYPGRVVRAGEEGARIRLTVDIGVELVVMLTKESFFSMGLNVGMDVWLTFKALSVKVH